MFWLQKAQSTANSILNYENVFQWGKGWVLNIRCGKHSAACPVKILKKNIIKRENKVFYFIIQWIKIHCSSMRSSHQYMSFKGRVLSTSWQELQCLLLALHHCVFQATGLCFSSSLSSKFQRRTMKWKTEGRGHHFVSHSTQFTEQDLFRFGSHAKADGFKLLATWPF